MASSLTITIANQPVVDDYFVIQALIDSTPVQSLSEIFKTVRSSVGQTSIGSTTSQTANNLRNALDVDWNNSGMYQITRVGNVVTITSNNPLIEFSVANNTNPTDVGVVISNDASVPFAITDIEAIPLPPLGDSTIDVYLDNAQWTGTPDASVDLNNTEQTYGSSAKSIKFNNSPNDDEVIFQDSVTRNGSDVSSVRFKVYLASSDSQRIGIQFRPAVSGLFATVNLPTGFFGYDSSVTGVWQEVEIPSTAFSNLLGLEYDKLRVYQGQTGNKTFWIDDLEIVENDSNYSPCDYVKLSVTCTEQADAINSPISQAVASNPFIFVTPRTYGGIAVQMTKDGVNSSAVVMANQILPAHFELEVVVGVDNIGTLTITPIPGLFSGGFSGLYHLVTPEYSINGTDWQTSTQFTGLDVGDYTLYIRDGIGCSTTIDFSVDEFNANLVDYEPIAEISNINSIRFKKNEEWTDENPRNPENTLSFEEDTELPNRYFMQLFQKNDGPIKTQVKTNYSTVDAKLIECNGDETPLIVTKVTDNMDKEDLRDGTLIGIPYQGATYVGIKFGTGSTYDPDTTASNGSYNLGENLPNWMNVGDYVNIQGIGWLEIISIQYYNGFFTAIVNIQVSGLPITLDTYQIRSVYNVVDFERYEFAIDFSDLEGHYKVQVDISDNTFGEVQFISEWLDVRDEHPGTFMIDYYNTDANEINYSTGIRHRIRIPYVLKLRWKPNGQQDIYVTDTNTVALENTYRSFWDFNVRPLPTKMAEKVVLALKQDRLFIDNVNYVMEGEPESKTIGSQYQVKANLVKADYKYDGNNSIVGEIVSADGIPLAIDSDAPGLLLVD